MVTIPDIATRPENKPITRMPRADSRSRRPNIRFCVIPWAPCGEDCWIVFKRATRQTSPLTLSHAGRRQAGPIHGIDYPLNLRPESGVLNCGEVLIEIMTP
jgi:hypothetical protein